MTATPADTGRRMLAIRAPRSHEAERRWVLETVVSDWLGLEHSLEFADVTRVGIRLVGDPAGRELTLPDTFFSTPPEDWLTERSMPVPPLAHLAADAPNPLAIESPDGSTGHVSPTRPLPVLFADADGVGRAWRESETGLQFSFDILGSVFFFLTRYEEIVRPDRDSHDRFPASASLAATEGFLDRPVVDEYVDLLWLALRTMWPSLVRRPSAFRLRLTHDVDLPWASLVRRAVLGDLVRRRDPTLAARRLRALLDVRGERIDRDPFNTFGFLMGVSERVGLRSTFYFRADGGLDASGARYRLTDPPIQRLLRQIHDRGHEVGLHTSYRSYRSPERTQAEFEALRVACLRVGFDQPRWGVRQHFLRLDNPLTWRNQESAGLTMIRVWAMQTR